MRLRNEKVETGHLLSFISKRDRNDNFSLFFPVEGLEQFDTLLEITRGFEKCLEAWPNRYDYMGYSVSKLNDIEETFPEIDANRVYFFEQSEFLSETSLFIETFGRCLLKRLIQKQNQIFPDIVTGAMAVGSSFYDREDSIRNIWETLNTDKNILFRAPRRFGKTSLLNHIARHPEKGWHACFVDLEGGDSAEKFVEKILSAMLASENYESFLPKNLSEQRVYEKTQNEQLSILREERKTIKKGWKEYAEMLFSHIEGTLKGSRFVFILDEVSFLIEDMIELKDDSTKYINAFINWFYDFRNRHKKIRFILSGSEHLPSFLSTFGIEGRLDDLQKVHLDLFDEDTTKEFIFLTLTGQKVAAGIREIELIQQLMGKPIPYFLHLFLDALCRTCREKKSLSHDDIVSVYDLQLLGSESKRYFESINRQLERYKRYGRRNMSGAKSILDRLAIDESPVSVEALELIWQQTTGSADKFDIMLDIMQDDFYISKNKHQQVFINSKLIKEWWRKHGISGFK